MTKICLICSELCKPITGESSKVKIVQIITKLFDNLSFKSENVKNLSNLICCPNCTREIQEIDKILQELKSLQDQLSRVKGQLKDKILFSKGTIDNEVNLIREEIVKALEEEEGNEFSPFDHLDVFFDEPKNSIQNVGPCDDVNDSFFEENNYGPENIIDDSDRGDADAGLTNSKEEFLKTECLTGKKRLIIILTPIPYENELQSISIKDREIAKFIENESKLVKGDKNRCSICLVQCENKFKLNDHIYTTHPNSTQAQNLRFCEICPKKKFYPSLLLLSRHMKRSHNVDIHVKKDNFTCTKCGKKLTSRYNLQHHILRKHPTVAETKLNLQCSICGKGPFESQQSLKDHVDRHVLKFKCQFCEKKFHNLSVRKNHERQRHIGLKPFLCDSCSKSFSSQKLLNVHYKHMHGVQSERIPCPTCGKFFKPQNLVYHIKIMHEKSFSVYCHKCEKGFLNLYNLKRHLKNHPGTKNKNVKCDYPGCIKEFTRKDSMLLHVKKKHSDSNVQNIP